LNESGGKWMLRPATDAIAFLHSHNYIHRNIKPSNFLIAFHYNLNPKYVIKLTDMDRSKNLDEKKINTGSEEPKWLSPEMILTDTTSTLKSDIFVLGCFYHFVLSGGHHPFGDGDTAGNIFTKSYKAYKADWQAVINEISEKKQSAINLMKNMISWEPDNRLDIESVLNHPYFQSTDSYNLYNQDNKRPGLCLIFNQKNFLGNHVSP
jgi:serine/threonine protein kinase